MHDYEAARVHRASLWPICPIYSGPSINVGRQKCQNIVLIKRTTVCLKQFKQLGHHPRFLDPTMGEGDVIRSPPVPSGRLECLKEIQGECENISRLRSEICVVLLLVEGIHVSEKKT